MEDRAQGAADPNKLREQRDLLIDLRQKVAMYERELALVHGESQKQIDRLEKENSELKRDRADEKTNRHIAGEIEQSNAQRTRGVLIDTKTELEKAAKTIKDLNQEIKV